MLWLYKVVHNLYMDIDGKPVGYLWLHTIYVNLYRITLWQFWWINVWYPTKGQVSCGGSPVLFQPQPLRFIVSSLGVSVSDPPNVKTSLLWYPMSLWIFDNSLYPPELGHVDWKSIIYFDMTFPGHRALNVHGGHGGLMIPKAIQWTIQWFFIPTQMSDCLGKAEHRKPWWISSQNVFFWVLFSRVFCRPPLITMKKNKRA